MRTNLVIFELNPEVLKAYRVTEEAMPSVELVALGGVWFNCDEATDDEWALFNKFNESVAEDNMAPGFVEVPFPVIIAPSDQAVYRIFMAM